MRLKIFILVLLSIVAFLAYTFLPLLENTIRGVLPIVKNPPPILEEALPFTLPEEFSASLYAKEVPGARIIIRAPNNTLLVSLTAEGKVVALPDENEDGKSDRTIVILENLDNPHGLALRCSEGLTIDEASICTLYVAEENVVRSFNYDPFLFETSNDKLLANLPEGDGHYTRSLLLHPNGGELLVSIGSSCNVCREEDEKRASIMSINLSSGEMNLFAKGLRNTVFMTTHPISGEVWGTDMGRDWLGDDNPPDEINILERDGNYGWPVCFGKNIHDTEFDKNTYIRNPCMEPFEKASHIDIQAHSAPLGIGFIGDGFPEKYRDDVLVALHGSWNRSVPTGYKVVRFPLNERGEKEGEEIDFMTGFTNEKGEVSGRPVGILIEEDGSIYVSDDRAGMVYLISYNKND